MNIQSIKTPLNFFALIVLVSEGILGGLAARADPTSTVFMVLVVGMLSVLIILIPTVAYISRKEKPAPVEIPPGGNSPPPLIPAFNNPRLEQQLKIIERNIRSTVGRKISILTKEISHELNSIVIESEAWSRGELHSSVPRYNSVVLTLYEEAKISIFSTTIRAYLVDWPEDLMDKMIAASEKSNAASITRVFVFAERKEIDAKAIQILRKFKKSSRIRPLVYIDCEDEIFDFPPDISRDFLVIDEGEAIGVTLSYGIGNLQAQWYFGDENRKQRFQHLCSSLERGSRTVDEILRWWDARADLPNAEPAVTQP